MRVDLDEFEAKYAAASDPWDFASSPYEQRKYELTVASLPRRHYGRAFEPGCSIGALTERLAPIADHVTAMEASPTAASNAVGRLARHRNVDVVVGAIPEAWPEGRFDLVVLSEIGYYWDAPTLAGIVDLARRSLAPGGDLIGVHWLGRSPDHLLHGSEVHRILTESLGDSVVHHSEPQFLLDVWTAE